MAKQFLYAPGAACVQTTKGIVRGYEYDGLVIFKGIPYAKAKRFCAPEPVDPWEGALDCTSYGYTCPIAVPGKPGGELSVPHRYWVQNEDCQNLNLWTPACDDKKRPVLVWLHGGGFTDGSAIEQVAYDGANMATYGDVVVISINHRLNVLGYFDVSDFGPEFANSGNAGGDDIIASLQWVHDNIASFGGDPDNVTVFGQSGGGAKVTTLLQSPAADGLFHKGINMSGVIGPVLADAAGSGKEIAEAVMAELGISTIQELQEVPYAQFRAAYDKVSPALRAAGKYVGCAPQKNAFYAGEPVANGFRKESAQVPLLVGSVFSEFLAFMPNDPAVRALQGEDAIAALAKQFGDEEATRKLAALYEEAYPGRPLMDLAKLDVIFRGPEIPYIAARSALNEATWSYLFDLEMPVNGGTMAWHCADIPYFFHNTELVENTQWEGTERLEQQVFDAVIAFARTGNPNHGGIPNWPASTPESENTLLFGQNTRMKPNHDHALQAALAPIMGPMIMRMFAAMAGNIQH